MGDLICFWLFIGLLFSPPIYTLTDPDLIGESPLYYVSCLASVQFFSEYSLDFVSVYVCSPFHFSGSCSLLVPVLVLCFGSHVWALDYILWITLSTRKSGLFSLCFRQTGFLDFVQLEHWSGDTLIKISLHLSPLVLSLHNTMTDNQYI